MNTLLLLLLAITPPIILMYFICWMDSHEPESLKNIILAMVIGAMSTIPAIIIQVTFESVPIFNLPGLVGGFYQSFFLVAPSEELAKFFFIYLFIRKKPFYNEINDGIVYYGAGALGFALLENIFYVFDYGFSTGVMRAFTSIPIHTFCGIIIGYHAGLARFTDQLNPKRLILTGLFLAYLTHALFNTIVSADSLLALLMLPLVALIYYAGYKVLRRGRYLSMASIQQPNFNRVINYRFEDIVADSHGRKHLVQKTEKWKALISRTLFFVIGVLWLLVFFYGDNQPGQFWELFLGMILLTIIPFVVGLLLERSYQRRKQGKIYIENNIS